MSRLTRPATAAKLTELQGILRRLESLHHAEVNASKGYTIGAQQARSNRAGRKHELDAAQAVLTELLDSLGSVGPMTNGQLGGQRQGGHGTSAAALELVAPKAGTQRDRVLAKMRQWPTGLADYQLVRMTGLAPNSLRPRRVELVDGGWLEDSGRRREHEGSAHVVWTLTEAARQTSPTPTTEDRTTP